MNMTREEILRSLSHSFDADYSTVSDLADVLGMTRVDYALLMHYLERAESLEDIWINCPVMDDGNEF